MLLNNIWRSADVILQLGARWIKLNFQAEHCCLTRLSTLFLIVFFSEEKLTKRTLSHIFQVSTLMLKGWPAVEEESGDLFPFKRF